MTKSVYDESPAAQYIEPLNMSGLQGRLLYMPAKNKRAKRELLMVYGHHSNLERWYGLAEYFNRYGAVTMPDLPGFGGMESLYKIGKKPDMDNMADYLAAFVRLRYKRKKVTIVGLSYGFLVATRMLQRYPELTKNVEFLVSAVGFAHHTDFLFKKSTMFWIRFGSKAISIPPLNGIFKAIALNPWSLNFAYAKTFNAKTKFEGADPETFKKLMGAEIVLWHDNDVRTHFFTTYEMLTIDNCEKQVDLPVWHVAAAHDQYFDLHRVEQHLRVIYTDVHVALNKTLQHAPSVVADAKEAASMIPVKVRKALLGKEA